MSIWRKIEHGILWTLTVVASLGLLAASYGGEVNPAAIKGICLMVMTFPAWALLMLLVTLMDLLWLRKALVACVLVWIACAQPLVNFMPLNIFPPKASKYADDPKFTFLTYNVSNFDDLTDAYPGGYNPTLSFILRSGADVVNLQESPVPTVNDKTQVRESQLDSLYKIYPYVIHYGLSHQLFSKYPAEAIHTPVDPKTTNGSAVFRLNIEGTPVTLIDVHLQSYGLKASDKELYRDITDMKDPDGNIKSTLRDVKTELLSKIQAAAVKRAQDTEKVCNYIERFGGPNVIVAGDFNDVPGSYPLRRLHDYDMKEVWPQVGFGPMITFHADRFYFRIDHVLYRGALQPLKMTRGKVLYSDHYPLLTTFAITPTDNN